ncbi:MAG: polyprenyl synthetase family protein [Flavobacteriales bacterium]|nr:polyprenyl synthetase family protein [Flavobacteriales bacterium]MCB9363671.1 polyprenyl synthetase family protein [Flavobacteriales bacterium]
MEKINHYISLVNQAIEELQYNKEPKQLYEPIKYTLSLGGKRIRPALLLLSNDLFGGKVVKAINAALAIEVFHNFTLVHDDIMDDAPLRRGKTTVFKKWNTNTAILSGDVMFVNAIQLLAKDNNQFLPETLSIFNKAAVEVCEGQQYDMDFETMENVSIDDYLKMIELKTAVLLAASLKIGAVMAEAKIDDANHIYEFGKNLGIAFQLMDDILDLYGDPEKFGKQVGGDVIANKKTYLLLKAKELATGNTRKELEFCLTSTALNPENKVERIKTIFNTLGVKKAAIEEMNLFYNTALSHLDSIDAPADKIKVFEDFAKQLMHREN